MSQAIEAETVDQIIRGNLEIAARIDLAVWEWLWIPLFRVMRRSWGGTPCLAGTCVPFQTLLDYLERGDSLDEFLKDFPSVSRALAVTAIQ